MWYPFFMVTMEKGITSTKEEIPAAQPPRRRRYFAFLLISLRVSRMGIVADSLGVEDSGILRS